MNIVKIINKEIIELKKILNDIDNKDLKVLDLLCEESKKAIKKNKILFCGNGGSAADAQHLATELVVKYKKKKKGSSSISTYH